MTIKSNSGDGPYFMTIPHTDAIRGALLTIVILFHETLLLDTDILPREGSYAVFVFFFLSGYGLFFSRKKQGYLSVFAQKKILGLLFRYWIIMIVLTLASAALWSDYAGLFDRVMDTFVSAPHWYILQLLCFYLVFWLVSIATEDPKLRIVILSVLVIVIMNIQYHQFDSALYRRSGFGFILGLLLAEHRDAFDRMTVWTRIVAIIICAVTLFFNETIGGDHASYGAPVIWCALIILLSSTEWKYSCPVFIILGLAVYPFDGATLSSALVLTGLCSFRVSRKILGHLGKYSLEMYLVHYTLLVYLYNEAGIDDATLLFVCTFMASLLLSVIIRTVSDIILKHYDDAVDRTVADLTHSSPK